MTNFYNWKQTQQKTEKTLTVKDYLLSFNHDIFCNGCSVKKNNWKKCKWNTCIDTFSEFAYSEDSL